MTVDPLAGWSSLDNSGPGAGDESDQQEGSDPLQRWWHQQVEEDEEAEVHADEENEEEEEAPNQPDHEDGDDVDEENDEEEQDDGDEGHQVPAQFPLALLVMDAFQIVPDQRAQWETAHANAIYQLAEDMGHPEPGSGEWWAGRISGSFAGFDEFAEENGLSRPSLLAVVRFALRLAGRTAPQSSCPEHIHEGLQHASPSSHGETKSLTQKVVGGV